MRPEYAVRQFWRFVAGFPRDERTEAMHELLDFIEEYFKARGQPVPAWAPMIRERLLRGDPLILGPSPERTIYGPAFNTAKSVVAANAPPELQALANSVIAELEVGWVRVRGIVQVASEDPQQIQATDVGVFALDVAELYRDVVVSCAEWIVALLTPCGQNEVPVIENVISDLVKFGVYSAVLGIAAPAAELPPRLRSAAVEVAGDARGRAECLIAALIQLSDAADALSHTPACDGEPCPQSA